MHAEEEITHRSVFTADDVTPPGDTAAMSGEDEGLEVRYSVTSVGGKRAVQKLALDIAAQVEADQAKPVPAVKLKKDHYTHKSYGRIFTPVFEVVQRWTDQIAQRPAVKRGRMVNRPYGNPASQLLERHDASDFELRTQDKLAKPE